MTENNKAVKNSEVILESEIKPSREDRAKARKEAKLAAKRAKERRKAAAALSTRQARAGYWFILPWVVGVIFLFLVPALTSLVYSFCSIKLRPGGLEMGFVGIKNYYDIFKTNPDFIPALLDSLKDMAYQVPIIAFFSMFIAQILNQKFVGRTFARVMFFLPVIIASGVILEKLSASGMSTSVNLGQQQTVFTFQEESVILKVLNQSGLNPKIIDYLKSLVGNIFDITWKSGIQILLYLSALQGIPKSYYEVSSMEGATAWEEYWKITFPLLSPMTLVCVVYTIIDSFTYYQNKVMQLIDANDVATGGAGIGSAMAWTYFAIIGIILALIVKLVFAKTIYTEE